MGDNTLRDLLHALSDRANEEVCFVVLRQEVGNAHHAGVVVQLENERIRCSDGCNVGVHYNPLVEVWH